MGKDSIEVIYHIYPKYIVRDEIFVGYSIYSETQEIMEEVSTNLLDNFL